MHKKLILFILLLELLFYDIETFVYHSLADNCLCKKINI